MGDFRLSSVFDYLVGTHRRHPLLYFYIPQIQCEDQENCPERWSECPYAHNQFETLYHPLLFKTRPCETITSGVACATQLCAFYHTRKEKDDALRVVFRRWENKWEDWFNMMSMYIPASKVNAFMSEREKLLSDPVPTFQQPPSIDPNQAPFASSYLSATSSSVPVTSSPLQSARWDSDLLADIPPSVEDLVLSFLPGVSNDENQHALEQNEIALLRKGVTLCDATVIVVLQDDFCTIPPSIDFHAVSSLDQLTTYITESPALNRMIVCKLTVSSKDDRPFFFAFVQDLQRDNMAGVSRMLEHEGVIIYAIPPSRLAAHLRVFDNMALTLLILLQDPTILRSVVQNVAPVNHIAEENGSSSFFSFPFLQQPSQSQHHPFTAFATPTLEHTLPVSAPLSQPLLFQHPGALGPASLFQSPSDSFAALGHSSSPSLPPKPQPSSKTIGPPTRRSTHQQQPPSAIPPHGISPAIVRPQAVPASRAPGPAPGSTSPVFFGSESTAFTRSTSSPSPTSSFDTTDFVESEKPVGSDPVAEAKAEANRIRNQKKKERLKKEKEDKRLEEEQARLRAAEQLRKEEEEQKMLAAKAEAAEVAAQMEALKLREADAIKPVAPAPVSVHRGSPSSSHSKTETTPTSVPTSVAPPAIALPSRQGVVGANKFALLDVSSDEETGEKAKESSTGKANGTAPAKSQADNETSTGKKNKKKKKKQKEKEKEAEDISKPIQSPTMNTTVVPSEEKNANAKKEKKSKAVEGKGAENNTKSVVPSSESPDVQVPVTSDRCAPSSLIDPQHIAAYRKLRAACVKNPNSLLDVCDTKRSAELFSFFVCCVMLNDTQFLNAKNLTVLGKELKKFAATKSVTNQTLMEIALQFRHLELAHKLLEWSCYKPIDCVTAFHLSVGLKFSEYSLRFLERLMDHWAEIKSQSAHSAVTIDLPTVLNAPFVISDQLWNRSALSKIKGLTTDSATLVVKLILASSKAGFEIDKALHSRAQQLLDTLRRSLEKWAKDDKRKEKVAFLARNQGSSCPVSLLTVAVLCRNMEVVDWILAQTRSDDAFDLNFHRLESGAETCLLDVVIASLDETLAIRLAGLRHGFQITYDTFLHACQSQLGNLVLKMAELVNPGDFIAAAISAGDVANTKLMLSCLPQQRLPKLDLRAASLNAIVTQGDVQLVDYAIQRNADVNEVKTSTNMSPLMSAIEGGNGDIVKLLLKAGADISRLTKTRDNMLHVAASGKSVEALRALVAYAVDHDQLVLFEHKNSKGKTPVQCAKTKAMKDMLVEAHTLIQINIAKRANGRAQPKAEPKKVADPLKPAAPTPSSSSSSAQTPVSSMSNAQAASTVSTPTPSTTASVTAPSTTSGGKGKNKRKAKDATASAATTEQGNTSRVFPLMFMSENGVSMVNMTDDQCMQNFWNFLVNPAAGSPPATADQHTSASKQDKPVSAPPAKDKPAPTAAPVKSSSNASSKTPATSPVVQSHPPASAKTAAPPTTAHSQAKGIPPMLVQDSLEAAESYFSFLRRSKPGSSSSHL